MEGSIAKLVSNIDWGACLASLSVDDRAVFPELLDEGECDHVAGLCDRASLFQSHAVMSRHGFGEGEYGYFAYPSPSLVQQLRGSLITTSRSSPMNGIGACR